MPVENAANASLLTSGTPLWASLLLSIVAVLGAHFLTSYREGKKRRLEELNRWKDSALSMLEQISDDAQAHYTDADCISSTPASAQKLLAKLKRFGALIRTVTFADSADAKPTSDLIVDLHTAITGPDDFQDGAREPKSADDPIILRIMECEDRMRVNISRPRKSKSKPGWF